jgi:short-subunit dehydrogenase
LPAVPLPPPAPDSTALVTGASAGIGRALARALAERGHGVTLVARRAERLEELARELSEAHGIRAEWVAADLSRMDERDRVAAEVEQRGLTVEILVNNAGWGIYQTFASSGRERELEQVRLLVEAVVDFDARYVPGMVERGRGVVVNLSSTAGFQVLPGNGTYSAAKAFVRFHTEALRTEVRRHGVTVVDVCPGPVATEFQEASKPAFTDRMPKPLWIDAERVARDTLAAIERERRMVVPGNPFVRAFFAPGRLMPTALSLPVSKRLMAKELER